MKLPGLFRRPLFSCVLGLSVLGLGLVSGCPAADAPAKSGAAPKEREPLAAVPEKVDAEDKAKAEAAPADADKAADAGDHGGCIYVDGEKGKDDLECPHPPAAGAGEAAEPDAPPNGDGHFGQAFAMASPVPLSAALKTASAAEPVLVSGEVEAVCEKKGCWMVIEDGADSARVLMKDHAFAVPMDCRGKKVQVEGTLASRTFTEAQVKHLAKDGGKNPDEVSGERTEHVLTATGINIQS